MKDILPDIQSWLEHGKRVAVATVTDKIGSAPREPGAKLAVNEAGDVVGSVSGGCVEPAVLEAALQVIQNCQPQLLEFGFSEEDNFAQIGLSCGGKIRVFVERLNEDTDKIYQRLAAELERELEMTMATVVRGPSHIGAKLLIFSDRQTAGTSGLTKLDELIARDATSPRKVSVSVQSYTLSQASVYEVFIERFAPPPELIIIGASPIAVALTAFAKVLQYHVVVIDARSAFVKRERFPNADEVIVAWPDEVLASRPLSSSTAVALLSHDPKFDIPTLKVLLSRHKGYIGVLGSRQTAAQRAQDLLREGCREEQIQRIHGPIGLAIGAVMPEEIALAIMAEIIAFRHDKRSG